MTLLRTGYANMAAVAYETSIGNTYTRVLCKPNFRISKMLLSMQINWINLKIIQHHMRKTNIKVTCFPLIIWLLQLRHSARSKFQLSLILAYLHQITLIAVTQCLRIFLQSDHSFFVERQHLHLWQIKWLTIAFYSDS